RNRRRHVLWFSAIGFHSATRRPVALRLVAGLVVDHPAIHPAVPFDLAALAGLAVPALVRAAPDLVLVPVLDLVAPAAAPDLVLVPALGLGLAGPAGPFPVVGLAVVRSFARRSRRAGDVTNRDCRQVVACDPDSPRRS